MLTWTRWLKERFKPLLNLFEDSWAYQEMVAEKLQEGLKEGRQEGVLALRETFVRYVQKNFPTLVGLTKQQTSLLTDIDRLSGVFDAVMDATTAAEVEAILVHLSDETQSTQ
jgi:flagellar biosynthesis/type III secretory pathway protein FliH